MTSEKISCYMRDSACRWLIVEKDKLVRISSLENNLWNCVPCLRAHLPTCLRAHLPTCLGCLRTHVSTCLACLRGNVSCRLACSRANALSILTCSRAIVSCVLTCSSASMPCALLCSLVNVFCVLSCSRASVSWVLTCLTCCYAVSSLPHMACVIRITYRHALVLMPHFSVSLPLMLKLYTLLVKFNSLINVFPR